MSSALDTIPRDARHLVLFDEIYRSQSMTRSAEKLGLSQPTVSIWLGKLRRAASQICWLGRLRNASIPG